MRGSLLGRRTATRLRQVAISAVGSAKIKLLLCCCVLFAFFATRTAPFMGWTDHAASLNSFSGSRRGYALLINTWKRNDLLKQSISHYTSCRGLDSIRIVWSEPNPPSDNLVKFLTQVVQSNSRDGRQIELKFDIHEEDSLNNRFKELKDLKTDAVLSIDDDIIFPCSTVEFAFSVWRTAPNAMVGWVPRMHWIEKLDTFMQNGNAGRYIYGGWWSVWWTGTFSMVLSKAAFFHKKYLSLYTNEMPASIREYVAKNRNCEDIAMSFLVANATGAPPIWVKGKIFEIGSTGISSLGGHIERRSECVNMFVAEYGRMPLVSTSLKAVDSRNIWFW
ncbi:glycosylinositol phosphorylceramide mannosyl transferase 1-like isoform X2 [Rhododendron vialii]|uniref:glycosylinositol phosphorylceramide mannosyl transferase 1-like isoform X2 n=1 Tax=Rhododendron vialii TaxID=182163 RepID=UPI0026601808|nr:glycosylinositol phosphorylceramide mannosyl transferase 1-like isoform X2 [Rhododendron vialii]